MPYEKFDIAKLERLNDPARFEYLPPEVIWAAAGVENPQRIVDIGAGTGLFACRFADMAPQAEVWAVDSEPAMVRWMMEHLPGEYCSRVHPVVARESSIPLPTGEADLVVMINVHHELADPRASYREALRLLRIGGTAVIADWKPGDPFGGPPQQVRADVKTIREVLDTVGFANIAEHDQLPRHSFLTACKPEVCSL